MVTVETLDLEVYSEADAARLLRVAPSTLHYWLEGGQRGDNTYSPVIRPTPLGRRTLSWAEFIEAGWLRAYRQNKIPMAELRAFIEYLRDELQVPYPLAHRKPLVSGRSLVLKAQEASQLANYYHLVDETGMLTFPGASFLNRVTWDADVAEGWRPAEDPDSTVLVQPDVRFGRPAVAGVSTITLYELAEEGASREELAAEFDLSHADVRWALSYEDAQHAETAA